MSFSLARICRFIGIFVLLIEFRDRLPFFDEGKPLNTYLIECECLGGLSEKVALKKGERELLALWTRRLSAFAVLLPHK